MTVTTGVTPRVEVPAPARGTLPHGLLDTVEFRDPESSRWAAGGIEWVADPCAPGVTARSWTCDDPAGDLAPGAADCVTGFADSIVVQTVSAGTPVANDLTGDSRRELAAGEQTAIERVFWADRFTNAAPSAALPAGAAATNPVVAVGALEDWLAQTYGAAGVLHMTRSTATWLWAERLLRVDGDLLLTALGTRVVAGGGYPGTGPKGVVGTGQPGWVFATPALFGYRSDPWTIDVFDQRINQQTVVTAREFVIGFDPCGVAAAHITPPA